MFPQRGPDALVAVMGHGDGPASVVLRGSVSVSCGHGLWSASCVDGS